MQPGAVAQVHVGLRQRLNLLLDVVIEGLRHNAPRDRPAPASAGPTSALSSISTGASGWRSRQFQQCAGRRVPAVTSSGARRAVSRGPLPPCAARVTRTDTMIALVQARATLAVRQKPLGAVQRQKTAGHGGNPGHHPAAMQIADPVRRAWPPDRIVQQRVITQHGDAHLARAGGGQNAQRHGSGQPSPRSSCAVSNSGRPTTLE